MANIVGYIYNEEYSHSRLVINWIRVLLFPLVALISLLDKDEFHIYKEEHVTYFSGIITGDDDKFIVKIHEDFSKRKVWTNLCSGLGILGFFPDYKKVPDYTCWIMREGDCVEYVALGNIDMSKVVLTRKEFLQLTNQTEAAFTLAEMVKYSGC